MAISYVGSAEGFSSNGNSTTITWSDASAQVGDFAIVAHTIPQATDIAMGHSIAGALSLPYARGWTFLGIDLFANDSLRCNLGVFAKFLTAYDISDTGGIVFYGPSAGLTEGDSTVASVFRGVDRTRPFDSLPQTATGINTANPDPPSLTTSGDPGLWVIAIGASGMQGSPGAGSDGYTSYSSGYGTNAFSTQGNDSNDSAVGIAYNSSPSTTENPSAWAINVAADDVAYSWCAATLAIRPEETTGIRFLGSVTNATNNGQNVSLDLTGMGLQENDIVIVASFESGTADADLTMNTSGYTETGDTFGDDTENCNLAAFYKVMGSSPDSTAVTQGTGTLTSSVGAVAMGFRGVDPVTPMDVTPTTGTGVNTGIPNVQAIDPVTPGCIVVAAVGAAFQSVTLGAPIMPLMMMADSIECQNDTDLGSVGMGFAPISTIGDPVGTTSAYTQTATGGTIPLIDGTGAWGAVSMALRLLSSTPIQTAIHAVGTVRY